ncbi:hypothetical protein ABZ905_09225 [Streptomyces parvus]|uniref:hypothetical protein n=1 Tax=Streptomyces parvus TaxID=66428 RepID=UPI0033C0FACB
MPRVDVETVLLCDVLPDGTVAGVALVEPIYDTNTGARVATRTVDPATGTDYAPTGTLQACTPDGCTATTTALVLCDTAGDGTITAFVRTSTYDCEGQLLGTLDRDLDGAPYTPAGTVDVCPVAPACESPTTPTATIGLCLPDGTPIAVTVVRDCQGAVTSEGWINLRTGTFSAGAPPVGTVACGDSQSVQVSGTFCDIDGTGDVVGLVLIEYSYAADGTIASVRLVDATTGATYTPVGEITTCPVGVEQPEQDAVQLCDVAADGTSTPFIRDFRRDEVGAIVGHSDYTLGGTAYTPAGTVGTCGAVICETLQLCDSSPAPVELGATSLDDPSRWRNLACPSCPAVDNPTLAGGLQALFDGGSVTFPLTPTSSTTGSHHWAAGALAAESCSCPDAEVTFTISAAFLNNGPANQQGGGTGLYLYDGDTLLASDGTLAAAGTSDTLTVTATVPLASVQAGTVTLLFQAEGGQQGSQKTWTVSAFDVQATSDCGRSFLRTVCRDGSGTVVSETDTLDGTTSYTAVGDVQPCGGPETNCGGGAGATSCGGTETAQLCDLTNAPATPIPVPADSFALTGSAVVIGDTLQFSRNNAPANGVAQRAVTGLINGAASSLLFDAGWGGGGNPPATNDAIYRTEILDGATVLATSTVNLSNGSGSAGAVVAQPPLAFVAPASGTVTVRFTDLSTGGALNRDLVIRPLTVETQGVEVTEIPFLRAYTYDCAGSLLATVDTTLDGATPYTVTGTVSQCSRAASAEDCRDCEQLLLCDVSDGVSTSFLRTVCRDCTGTVISTLDTALDGTAPYTVAGTVGRCCDTTVMDECTYSLPDTPDRFDIADPAYPGCWVGTAAAPSYAYGDRVASWAATYQSDTGSASVVLFTSPDLGGAINFTAFTPALPVNPAQSAPAYTGTAVINGVTVTLTATAGDGLGIWQANNTGLYLGGGDAFRLTFSEPVRLTVNTSGFADPPTLRERFCGVTAETVPWDALRLSDCNGTVTAVDPETREPIPAGAVLNCQVPPGDCEAAAVQVLRLCDLNPDVAPGDDGLICATPFLRHFVYDCAGTATFHDTEMDGVTEYTPVEAVDCGESAPSLREQVWNTTAVVQDPVNPLVFTYTVANSEDPTQTGTVRMTSSRAFGGSCPSTATAPVFNGPVTFLFEPDATVLALADVLRVDALDWDAFEDKVVSPAPSKVESDTGHTLNPGNRWHSTVNNNTGHFYFNGPPASVSMFNRNDGGGVACAAPAFGFITLVPGPPCGAVAELDHVVQPLCDVAAAGTTPFLRHWSVNNATGLLTALADTTLDGTTSYAVTGTVTVCGQQADAPVLTGVRRVTGSTAVQNLKGEFPGLQSVSLSVLAGSVNVAGSSGTSQPLPAGSSFTWSVSDTDDSSLAAASFAGTAAAADYVLVWTYKGTAAG